MKINEIFTPSELTFTIEMRGYHHGQTDLTLNAFNNGVYVGKIDYSVYKNEPSVQIIEIEPSERRKGYGTALVRKLQSEFPNTEINMGMLSNEGAKLLATIPYKIIQNLKYEKLKLRLDMVKEKLALYSQMASNFQSQHPGQQWSDELRNSVSDWNDLHTKEYKLEQISRLLKPSKKLYV